ncbi:MAG: MMPL family transporter [Acidimicrobiales bacterium]
MALALHRLGRWCVTHRRRVLLLWLATLIGLGVFAGRVGGEYTDTFRVPGVESQQATDLLQERFPTASGTSAQLVFHADDGGVLDGGRATVVAAVIAEVGELRDVESVTDPTTQLSPDGRTALAQVQYGVEFTDLDVTDLDALLAVGEPLADQGLQMEVGGELPQFVEQPETQGAELIGLLAAVLILLLAFGSILAMGLPIGIALFGLGISVMLLTIVAAVVDVPTTTPILASMIGIGVGIDYALFVVTRHREHLHDGMTVTEAAARAIATAGQAVIIAGGTVVIAILGLAISGIPMVAVMGMGAAVVVAVMVIATVTLLPALLGFAGHNIDRYRVFRAHTERAGTVSIWSRWGTTVARRPWPYLIASLGLLLALAAPVLSIRFGQTDSGTSAETTTQRQAYDIVADAYGPGVNGPLLLAIESGDEAVVAEVVDSVNGQPGVAFVAPPQISPEGDAAIVSVIPEYSPQAEGTAQLIHRLRNDALPEIDTPVYVGGLTATFVDLSDKVASRLPWFIGAVVGLSFLLLMVVFRSVLVPLKAALMNLLSIGAAYGVIVAIFQWGWGMSLVGLQETVPIVAFVPMMMFAILFGLSMDYEVFLLSRVREEYLATGDNTGSVISGIASTARVITSAALIMICVFLGFVLGEDPVIKMMGIGLATAVFVDATIVRVVLVPSTMRLLGDANWWLPAWLDRLLPHIDVEGGNGLPEPEFEDRVLPSAEPVLVDA